MSLRFDRGEGQGLPGVGEGLTFGKSWEKQCFEYEKLSFYGKNG